MRVVVNTTPIISLAAIGQLDLLQRLFGQVSLAEAVYQELKAKPGYYGHDEIDQPWIEVRAIHGRLYKQLLLNQLDSGEAETIILAKELDADFVIIDENLGYRFAAHAGLTPIRTLSLLLRAKERRDIPAVKPLLDAMIAKGRWYSTPVYRAFLQQAGELGRPLSNGCLAGNSP
jgi:predicted nucleic acid-binding protein